jgi:hypothetical protein
MMRTLLLGMLLTSFTTLAQTSVHSNLNTSINDDNKTYSIRIDGDRGGKAVHYRRTFDVAGMSQEQKDAIKNRALDSLGLGDTPPNPTPPNKAITPGMEKVTFTCPTCTGKTRISINGNGFSAEREIENDKNKPAFPFDLEMPPGTYRYEYRQNDVLQMQLPFTVKTGQGNMVQVK